MTVREQGILKVKISTLVLRAASILYGHPGRFPWSGGPSNLIRRRADPDWPGSS